MNAVTDAFDGDLTFDLFMLLSFYALEGGLVAVWVR